VGGNGEDGDYAFCRAVIPEYPVSGRRFLFCIGFKDLFTIRTFQTHIFVILEAIMSGVHGQELDGLLYRFIAFLLGCITFKRGVNLPRFVRPFQLKQSA